MAASVSSILRNQQPGGAFVASPDFGQYQYCWLRDSSFIAYALDRVGEYAAAARFHAWCAAAIDEISPLISKALDRQAAGLAVDLSQMPPARFSLDGRVVEDDWPNFQIDGYGAWLWALDQHLRAVGEDDLPSRLAPAVERTASYIAALGTTPCYDVWEEAGDSVHTTTLACVYAGLSAAATLLRNPELAERAARLRSSMVEEARRYGRFRKSDHSQAVDASLLWLCEPFHLVPPGEHAFVETVRRITAELDLDGGIRRYPTDTYYGGGAWPVLTASLGWYHAATGDLGTARRYLAWVARHFDAQGRLAEQFGGEGRDPEQYQQWVARWGPPAADLVWSHAMYIVLAIELEARQTPNTVTTTTEPIGSPQ